MSKNGVDTRVVRMEFDNAKFEKNVKQTTKSLDKLNQSMAFHDADKGLEKVRLKISAMEVAATAAIANVTTRVVNLGIQLVKSLSVDNIASGWAKYGDKTTSVATMIAQKIRIAGKEITDQSEKLEIVNEQLERLSWFSDETSYSFTDMVNNAGKFIATGQDLDTSVKAMEGIATWAALSGQNAATASRAMYQLAQAMGKGKVQKIDWMSIQNANMDTEEFRETILATAVSLGELTKESENFVTKTGKKFTTSQFADFLSEGWFTSDVLVKGLDKYSAAIDQIYDISMKTGKTASEVIEEFGDQLDVFGVKAFKAAQEARTFTDVLNSVKDAVSSKWMTTFENIFGGQEASIKLWTDLANELYDMFAASGDFRNAILSIWGSLGGSADLFAKGGQSQGAFWNIYDAIVALKKLIKSAWNAVFPLSAMEAENDQAEEIGRNLKQITNNIKSFSERVLNTVNYAGNLTRVFKILFNGLKFGLQVIQAIRYAVDPIIETVKQLIGRLSDELLYYMERFSLNGSVIESIAIRLHNVIEDLLSVINIEDVLEIVLTLIRGVIDVVSNLLRLLSKAAPIIKTVTKFVIDLIKKFLELPKMFDNFIKDKTGKSLIEHLESFFDTIISIFDAFNSNQERVIKKSKKIAKKAEEETEKSDENKSEESKQETVLSPIMVFVNSLVTLCEGLGTFLSGALAFIGHTLSAIGNGLAMIGNVLNSVFTKAEDTEKKSINPAIKVLIGILIALTIVVGIIFAIGTVINNAAWNLMAMINPLGNISDALSDMGMAKKIEAFAVIIREIANAFLKIALAFVLFEGLSETGKIMLGIVLILGVLVAAIILMKNMMGNANKAITDATSTLGRGTKVITSLKDGVMGLFDAGKDLISSLKENTMLMQISSIIYTFGNMMLKLALAFAVFDQVSWEGMLRGIAAIGVIAVLFGAIILISKIGKDTSIDIKSTKASFKQIIGFAIVIKTLGKVMSQLADLGWEGIFIALTAIAGVLGAFVVLALITTMFGGKTMEKGAHTLSKSVFSFAMSLLALSIPMIMLSKISWENIGKTFAVIGGMLSMIFGTLGIMTLFKKIKINDVIPILLSLGGIIISLLVFVKAAEALTSISWESIGKVFAAIGGMLLTIVGVLMALKFLQVDPLYIVELSGSLVIFSLALIPFSLALSSLSEIGFSGIATGLFAIAGAFAIIGISAIVLKGVLPIILALSTALVLTGVGILIAGVGLSALADGLLAMSSVAGDVMANFTQAFAEMGPQFFEALGKTFGSFFTGLIEGFTQVIPALIDLVTTLLSSILDLIINFVPKIINPVISMFVQLLEELASYAERIADAVWRIILAVLKTLDDHGEDIFYHVFGILLDLIKALSAQAKDLVNALMELVVNIFEGFVEWLGPNIDRIINIILDFIGIILKALATNIVKLAALAAKVFLTLFAFAIALAITLLGSLASLLVQFVGGLILLLLTVLNGFGRVLADGIFAFIITVIDLLVYVISNSGALLVKAFKALFLSLISMLLGVLAELIKDVPLLGLLYKPITEAQKFIEDKAHETLDVNGYMKNLQDSISTASSNILNTISWTVDGIGDTLGTAVTLINKTTDMASSTLNDAFDEFNDKGKDTGADFIAGMMDAIDDSADGLADKSGKAVDKAVDSARDAAGVHSPSVIMMEIGEYMMEGLSIGIQNKSDSVYENMSKALDSTIGLAKSIISDQEEGNDITLVVGLDTSNVESQAARVNDIMSGITNPELSFYGQNADRIARSSKKTSSSDLDSGKTSIDKSNNVTYNNTFNISAENAQETADEIDKKLKEQSMRAKFAKGGI